MILAALCVAACGCGTDEYERLTATNRAELRRVGAFRLLAKEPESIEPGGEIKIKLPKLFEADQRIERRRDPQKKKPTPKKAEEGQPTEDPPMEENETEE